MQRKSSTCGGMRLVPQSYMFRARNVVQACVLCCALLCVSTASFLPAAYGWELQLGSGNQVMYTKAKKHKAMGGVAVSADGRVLYSLPKTDWSVLFGGWVQYPVPTNEKALPFYAYGGARYFGIPFLDAVRPYLMAKLGYSQGDYECDAVAEEDKEAEDDNSQAAKSKKVLCHMQRIEARGLVGVQLRINETFYVFLDKGIFSFYPWDRRSHPQKGNQVAIGLTFYEQLLLPNLILGIGMVF